MSKKDLKDLASQFKTEPSSTNSDGSASNDDEIEAALNSRLAAVTKPGAAKTPPKKKAQKPKAAEPAKQAATEMKKATVQLPSGQVSKLRDWKTATGRSTADAILSAYIDHIDTIRDRYAPSEEDTRRVALGLSPLATTQPTREEPRSQVGLYIRMTALEELDDAAQSLSISRSQLVADLLDTALVDVA